MKLVVFCCFYVILWMFILRLLVEMGQFGNGSLISLRRGFPLGHWALCMMFPYTQGRFPPFSSGLPVWKKPRREHLSPEKECKRTTCLRKALAGFVLSPFIWVCMFLCTMDFEHLGFLNQICWTATVDIFPRHCVLHESRPKVEREK